MSGTYPNSLNAPSWIGEVVALLFGALLPFAFAPTNFWILALICPAVLLFLWLDVTPKRAFWRGAFFGLGYFGVGVSWIFISLTVYGDANYFLAGSITGLLIFALLLFIATQGYLLARFFPSTILTKCLLAFPSLWVLFEWIRTWFLTGFPWLFLGYSQLYTPLRGFAPIVGVYGVSWLVACSAGILTYAIYKKKAPQQALIAALILLAIWTIGYLCAPIKWTIPNSAFFKVSLIQGNIPQQMKWEVDQAEKSLNLYTTLTEQHLDSPLIVWPEAAITFSQIQAEDFLTAFGKKLKMQHITLITGIPIIEEDASYNGMIAIGNGSGSYLKRHLVPFGEYMPFRPLLLWLKNYLQIPMADFSAGANKQPLPLANGIPIAGSICYEVAYPHAFLANLPQGQLLITLSDDTWFGRSLAPAQHVQIVQMRALETGRYALMSTNDAITAIIAPTGKVLNIAPPFQQYVLEGKIQAMIGKTPWVWMGLYPILGLVMLLLCIAYVCNQRKRH